MSFIASIRPMTVKELIAELSTYPPGMPSPIVSAHCERHGYDAPHVETAHGLRCLRCINERRRSGSDGPEMTYVIYPFPCFELRFPHVLETMRRAAAHAGFHWEPRCRAWICTHVSRAEEFYAYADDAARTVIDAWRADMSEKAKKVEEVYANGRR